MEPTGLKNGGKLDFQGNSWNQIVFSVVRPFILWSTFKVSPFLENKLHVSWRGLHERFWWSKCGFLSDGRQYWKSRAPWWAERFEPGSFQAQKFAPQKFVEFFCRRKGVVQQQKHEGGKKVHRLKRWGRNCEKVKSAAIYFLDFLRSFVST